MFAVNNRISKRQVMRLLTFDLLGYSALMIPSSLAREVGTDGIFSLLLGIGMSFAYLLLIRMVIKRVSSTYSAYIEETFGRLFGGIIKVGYMVYFHLLAGRVAAIFAELVGKELLEEQFPLILLILLALTFYGVIGGIEGRARVYEILFWIVLVPLLIMMFATLPTVDADYWMPVFVTSKEGMLRGGYNTFLSCSVLCLLPFLVEYVKRKECLFDSGKWALFITGGILCLLYLILLGMFGSAALATMDYPVVTMMSRAQITGGFLKRVDAIMFGIWFFTLYALLNSLVFFGGRIWRELLGSVVETGMKKLYAKEAGMMSQREEKYAHKFAEYICILTELILVFFLANEVYGSEAAQNAMDTFFWYIGMPFVVLVPLLLLIWPGKKSIGKGNSKVEETVESRDTKSNGIKYRLAIVGLGMLLFLLTACAPTEVEDREFPVLLEVKNEENFAKEWLNSLQQGNKKVDYNHLKVVLISKSFLENEAAMTEMLHILKQDKNVPLNAYVVITEQMEELMAAGEQMEEPLGDYIEKLLENTNGIKKETFPTIGMLYQEQENGMETLFIPTLSLIEEKPEITSYEGYKRGRAVGMVETDAALLSFFINNQLEEYVLQLGQKDFVRFFHADNKLIFEEYIEKSGLIRKRVKVQIACDGEVIYEKVSGEGEEVTGWLETQFVEYMKKISAEELERGIDLTNSKKKLGGAMRDWYARYQDMPEMYEEDIQIVFDVAIRWVEN